MKTIFIIFLSMAILLSGCTPAQTTPPVQPSATAAATADRSSLQYPETGPIIRLSYDPALTGAVVGSLVPAVSPNSDQPFFMVHPAYVQLRFPELGKEQTFQPPYPIEGPQLLIFRVGDFGGYDPGGTSSYSQQAGVLQDLIEKGIDPAHCAAPLAGADRALPFLPLVNAAQVFCAKAQVLSFNGGKGIRYITYYSQGIGSAAEAFAFYTFQGLSADGQYYLSAVLPVRTNILPNEPTPAVSEPDVKRIDALLRNQVAQINAQADDRFTPALSVLDGLMGGINLLDE